MNRADAPVFPHNVDEKRFAACADHGFDVLAPAVEVAEGVLNGFGFRDR